MATSVATPATPDTLIRLEAQYPKTQTQTPQTENPNQGSVNPKPLNP